ncbi:DUF4349 domain-containing protein [Pseudonocardia sichuanensis]
MVWIGAAVLLAVLVAALAVVQQGSGSGTDGGSGDVVAVAPARPAPDPGSERAAREDGAADLAAPQSRAGDDGQSLGVPLGGVQRELVRTAQLGVEVADPATAARQVRTAAAVAGGFVTEEQSGDAFSSLVLRVPAPALDRVIDDVAALGRVTARSAQVLDATEEVVDLDARVASQTASVARVRGLLAEAVDLGDVVAIESELAHREAELDSLTARLGALRDQVALSTLTVELHGPGAPPAVAPRAAGFLDGLAAGWTGLRAVGAATAAVVGFVVPFVPVLAVLGGIAWLGRRAVRTRRSAAGGRSGGPGAEGET